MFPQFRSEKRVFDHQNVNHDGNNLKNKSMKDTVGRVIQKAYVMREEIICDSCVELLV